MTTQRPFRFGVITPANQSYSELTEQARKLEKQGYNILLLPDHFEDTALAPSIGLMAAAGATTRLRIGSFVFNNDFRPPALLAKEAATLDQLSEGRFELGIGAGYLPADYEQGGYVLEKASLRIERLEESLRIIKQFFTQERVSFEGEHYTIRDLPAVPRGIQQPHPPVYIGGGGKRVLTLAAREANIVGLTAKVKPDGKFDFTDISAEASARKIAWVKQAAEDRWNDLEINSFVFLVNITQHRSAVAEQIARHMGVSTDDILHSPHCLIGTPGQICDDLLERQSLYGISYITTPLNHADELAPVVERLSHP